MSKSRGAMHPETLEALKKSIRKWQRIAKSPKHLDEGDKNCALCQRFDGTCGLGSHGEVCPVSQKVKDRSCHLTPYDQWQDHHKQDHGRFDVPCFRVPHCKECLTLAKDELRFLESLLPRKERP